MILGGAFMPKISIILPVYNAEQTLPYTLKSISQQTFTDFEVICINDGSKDISAKILDNIAAEDPRFKVTHISNRGVSYARNLGIEKAQGKYIMFCDSDDYMHPQLFQIAYTLIVKNCCDLLFWKLKPINNLSLCAKTDFEHIDVDHINCYSTTIEEAINKNLWQYVYLKIVKTSIIKQCSFPLSISLDEDGYFSCQVFSLCKTIYEIQNILYYYYTDTPNSLTNRPYSYKNVALVQLYTELSNKTDNEALSSEILKRALKTYFTARLLTNYTLDKNIVIENGYSDAKKALFQLKSSDKISLKEKLIYSSFFYFPYSYKFFRVKGDKTMKTFFRRQKQELKEHKKAQNL